MKSRISFFNGTALRKDITRFTPVWGLYLIGGLLMGIGTVADYYYSWVGYSAVRLADSISVMAVVNLAYALLCAELLFGDLFNGKLCNAIHAFPLRRESWFLTHTIAGLGFSIVPNVILCLCFMPFLEGMWYVSLIWLLGVTLEYVFFFGLAAFSAICTGNRLGMAAVYGVVNFLSMLIRWFVGTFYEPLLYGLHIRDEGFSLFSPSVWIPEGLDSLVMFDRKEFTKTVTLVSGSYEEVSHTYIYKGFGEGWGYLAVLAVLGLVLLGLGVLLYRRRKLESAGDLIAFKPMAPVFSMLMTLCVGAVFQLFGDEFFGSGNYLFLIVGIVVGGIGCEMLLQRTVKVFKKWTFIKLAAVGGALALSIGITALDPLGVTRWTPDPAQVESIVLAENYYYDPEYTRNALEVTNPNLIGELVEVHQQILAEGKVESASYGYIEIYDKEYITTSPIHLTYKMKDGREIERRYYYRANGEAADKLVKFFGAPEYVLGYDDWEEFLDSLDCAYVDWNDGKVLDGEEMISLAEAVKKDCEEGNMIQSRNDNWYYWVNFELKDDSITSVIVYEDSENTLKWMQDHGYTLDEKELYG